MGDISDTEEFSDLFSDPEGYYKPPAPPTFEEFTRQHSKSGYTPPKGQLTPVRKY